MVKLSLAPAEDYTQTNLIGRRDRRRIEAASCKPEARPRRYRGRGELRESVAIFSSLSEPFLSLPFASERTTKAF